MDLPPVPVKSFSTLWPISRGRVAPTVTASKVTTLDHEVFNDTVEGRAFVTKALFAGGQSTA